MVEQGDCVDDVKRRPAKEEFKDDYEKHLNDALLVQQTLLCVGSDLLGWENRVNEQLPEKQSH